VLLGHYKPEELSLEVDNEKVILHGQQEFEQEDGFEKSEFKRVFKLPQGVDPTTVTSRITQSGSALVIEGIKHEEDKVNGDKFEAKLDFRGFKPEEIKMQLRENVLTVTGIQVSERHQASNSYSRCIVLPDDVDPRSITSRLSKEGLLTIQASRDPALLSRKSSGDVTSETDEGDEEPKQKTSADAGETADWYRDC
jgi:HSP20 family molecular chaperone IbpA